MKQRLTLASLLLALTAYGCAPVFEPRAPSPTAAEPAFAVSTATSPSPPATSAPSPSALDRPRATTPPNLMEPGSSQLVDEVMRSLSERSGTPVAEITILEVESVMWPNAGLGCPAPGQMYAQVETPGWRITLRAEGEPYMYHTDIPGNFLLCSNGRPFE